MWFFADYARTKIARALVGICIVVAVVLGAKFTYDAISLRQNKDRIGEISRQTLGRMELMADYAVITLSDLAAAGLSQCDSAALMELRRMIYLRGSIKDIQVIGANEMLRCAGMPQSRLLGFADFSLNDGAAARSGNIIFHDLGTGDSGLLAVGWRFRSDLTYLAILNADALMFDVFPAALRDDARAQLRVTGKPAFAKHPSGPEAEIAANDVLVFTETSERYPLEARLEMSESVLAGWNRQAEAYVLGAAAVLGAILAVLIVSLMARPLNSRKEMEIALRRGEFVPYMQPTFSIDGSKIVGCEVLTRWRKQDGSIVQPLRFIPTAEENGMIIPITRSIVRTSLLDLAGQMRADPNFKVAFNIVPADLISENFAKEIEEIAKETGAKTNQIVLELTERQQFESPTKAAEAIKHLQNSGFRIALDDTGTGHNGLSYVQELGANIIKIDKHFIDIIGIDRSATVIVEMLVRLARELGMTTVAEGIETQQQLDVLRACNVDEGQGYLISPPVPIDEFMALVAAKAA